MSKTLFIEDRIISKVMEFYNLKWVYDEYGPCLADTTGALIEPYDDFLITIPDMELTLDNGESFICDGVLLFGDGTLEFRESDSQIPRNWSFFTDISIEAITAYMNDLA